MPCGGIQKAWEEESVLGDASISLRLLGIWELMDLSLQHGFFAKGLLCVVWVVVVGGARVSERPKSGNPC